ncbi:MAG: uroporphyrinogen decarboxylase family protein [Promethearchaeota archaeon]
MNGHSHAGKQRILAILNHEVADEVAWVPFAGVHAGKLKNYLATEILTDGSKLLECLREVKRLYHPDGQPVLFDLQVEAEILGCKLRWADKAPPSVETHPLATTVEIPSMIPKASDGRLPMILDVMKTYAREVGDEVALFGLVTGPLTLASHLRGTNLFMDLIRKIDYSKALFNYTSLVAKAMADLYIESGMDIIAVVDPVVSQISPRMFKKLLHEPFMNIFSHVKESGAFTSFFVCGDATKNIEPMCLTSPDSIFVDENIDMKVVKPITDKYNVVLGGNIPLTSVMLYGTQQDNMKYVIDLIDTVGPRNLIIAPGCDMPFDIPPENVVGVVQAVKEPEKVKKALEDYRAAEELVDIALPDYENLNHLLIEVFTLDSATCAACGYMKSMAFTAIEEFESDEIEIVEYKWTVKENISRSKLLGLRHLPSILFNGKIKYSSIIPSKEEYFNDIRVALDELAKKK